MGTLTRRAFLKLAALAAATSALALPLPAARTAYSVRADPEHGSDWRGEWESLVAVAMAEGRLSFITWGDTWGGSAFPGFRGAVARFEEAFPGIFVDHLPESSASVWLDRVRQSRRAGSYAFDVGIVQPGPAILFGRPEGIWAPIRPLLFHPEVLSDAAWRDGFDARYLDAGGDLCFSWEYQALHAYAVNTELVQDGEISSVTDLLDSKWTGRIISSDPRVGLGLHSAAAVANVWGTDVVKWLLVDQRPAFTGNARNLAESMVHGRYPVALGVRPKALAPFQENGLADKVRWLDLSDADFAATTSLLYVDRAPHPAAAKLFANWILTREGQAILASSLPANSARTDLSPVDPDGVATVGTRYYEPDREANFQHTAATQSFIRNLPGAITLTG